MTYLCISNPQYLHSAQCARLGNQILIDEDKKDNVILDKLENYIRNISRQ